MNNDPTTTRGKIIIRGHGTGEFSQSDIETRAREIAMISGRDPELVTEMDRRQAARELQGDYVQETPSDASDAENELVTTRDPSDPAVDSGHQTPNRDNADEQSALEHLAVEGVEEAQHEQMIEARRSKNL